ncbi:MAG: restriction endonuclease, partial [Micrococcales bacterium]|nr:restriction endonuclease [Micrococcales bacterium]
VFITSSSFTQAARDAVRQANARIELIDGQRLAKLMVDNGIGVQAKSSTTVYALDDDFFEE